MYINQGFIHKGITVFYKKNYSTVPERKLRNSVIFRKITKWNYVKLLNYWSPFRQCKLIQFIDFNPLTPEVSPVIFDFKIKYYINKIKKKKTKLCLIYNLSVLFLNMLSIFFQLTQVKRYTCNKTAYKKNFWSQTLGQF